MPFSSYILRFLLIFFEYLNTFGILQKLMYRVIYHLLSFSQQFNNNGGNEFSSSFGGDGGGSLNNGGGFTTTGGDDEEW